ncbi:WD40-repeat-containing domain protein [Tribonema minus]|uniref:WD40-repeat-containing domain protein n=1 Tax=Tribonema minus TaxID=303371 RepID=A0A835Z4V0_9STRA|nr:WD40-repeat-containing domain protein [Tribonema minus]
MDEDVSSNDEGDGGGDNGGGGSDDDSDAERERAETAEEKRLRLAQEYLAKLGGELGSDEDAAAGDGESDSESEGEDGVINRGVSEDRLARRLERERLAASGQLQRRLAAALRGADLSDATRIRALSGHRLAVTCVALSGDDATAFSGSKDNAVLRWDVETGARKVLCARWKKRPAAERAARGGGGGGGEQEHCAEVLAIAASTDGRYVAAGGRDKLVRVWDCRTDEVVASFSGHRDAVTALAFRHGSYSLYSGSADRSIKHWGLSEMAYVETLFGHQGEVNALDAFRRERAVSGARDGTARAWKILEETHLVFRPGAGGSVDAVACIDDEWFLSGGEDGALSLWFNLKKKPVAVAAAAHGVGRNGVAPWVCAAAAVRSSDLAVTGSSDGYIRLWHCDTDARTLEQVNAIPLAGFVNGLSVASTGRFAVAAVGQDHRLGRWERQKDARNRVCIVPLTAPEGGVNGGGDDEDE